MREMKTGVMPTQAKDYRQHQKLRRGKERPSLEPPSLPQLPRFGDLDSRTVKESLSVVWWQSSNQ
jgi:hypothetical protein